MNFIFDVAIVGGGIVGATTTLLLAKNTNLNIALIEAKTVPFNQRISAISLASQKVFQEIDIWNELAEDHVSPYFKMHVWDAGSNGKIEFDRTDIAKNALGYIIEDEVILKQLTHAISKTDNIQLFCPLQLAEFHRNKNGIELISSDGVKIQTALVVGADGANSWVRSNADITLSQKEYDHTAIVCTVKTELPHQKTAWQRFLPSGPLALLPLQGDHFCSIVWSCTPEKADELINLDDENFCEALQHDFEAKLGKIVSTSKRISFKLVERHAKNYVKQNVALIGDAAHTIHPLAGQGLNLGIADAAILSEIISQAFKKNRDYFSFETLRKYERARKSDNLAMSRIVGFLKNIFATVKFSKPREIGLAIADTPFIKKFIIQYAE